MWSYVELCGAMWSYVKQCGTHNRDVGRCGAMWDGWYDAYILVAIRFFTIEFNQKIGNKPMPHITNTKVCILLRHKASRRVLVVVVVIVV